MRMIPSAVATAALLTLALAGCGSDSTDDGTSAEDGVTSESPAGDEAASEAPEGDDTNDAAEAGSDAQTDDGAGTSDDTAATGDPASDNAGADSGETTGTDDTEAASGPADCQGAVETFFKFTEAALGVVSTSVTNAEVTDLFGTAVETHEATSPAPPEQAWADFGAVLTEYHTAWSELPPDGLALEQSEAVEERVDTFAESIGFDNDNYDRDAATIVGEECAAEFAAISGG